MNTDESHFNDSLSFLDGGGAMGELIRGMDWASTPLGPAQHWPQSLRTTLSLCLASNFPLCFIWGSHRIQFYNDGYWPICADKHPQAMGQDYKECWASAWPVIGPQFERCLQTGETSFVTDSRMFLDRSGFLEETFFTYSYSPIRDETGSVAGIFHPVNEATHLVLAERRLRQLRSLADLSASAVSVESAIELAAKSLAEDTLDVPFLMIYRIEAEQQRAVLAAATKVLKDSAVAPATIDLNASPSLWALKEACESGQAIELQDIQGRFGPFDCGPYEEAPQRALVWPIRVTPGEPVSHVMVAGVSARRPLDDAYRRFYSMLQDAVSTALTNAQAHADTKRRAEVLQQLDKAKTDFFSNVSHEFRTPLTLMLGPLEDMLNQADEGLTAPSRERLRLVYRNGLRLLKLVNTLLDFSRNEAGRIQAVFEATDLKQLTEELCGMFRSTIEQGGLRFTVDCQPLYAPVPVDRDIWEKIVLNLLSNAFKFTLEGEITVQLLEEGGRVVLRVIDTGAGIPETDLQKVFERFHRVQGSTGRSFEGSGIGLALVRDLVRLHEGEITVSSTVGLGSVFEVRMPMRPTARLSEQPALPEAARAEGDSSGRARAYLEEISGWLPAQLAISADTPQGDAAPRPRVLLADDNADMRAYVRSLLADSYTLDEVANGQEALARIQVQLPDLVLTDVMMPVLDGFGLLSALRADPVTRSLPVIMLSARAGDEARVEGLDAGADDYLVKPFSAQELKARIRTNLALYNLRQEMVRRAEQEKGARQVEAQARIFDTALSNTADFVYTFDLAGRFTYINRALLDLWGKTADEAVGKNFFELDYPPDLAGRLQAQIQQVIVSKAPIRDETPYSSVQGTRDYEYIFVPVMDSEGTVIACRAPPATSRSGAWPCRACKRTAARRTSSWPCWRMSCATRCRQWATRSTCSR
ncbi:MAG: response regulator [Rubrivivax sp.]|nr:MAG: response regulator [Rubrivivax sp.]